MEIDAVPAILELVAEGHGFAVLSPRALHGAATARAPALAATIVQPQLRSALAIVTSAQRPSTPLQKATIAMIEELAGPRARARVTRRRRRGGTTARRSG